MLPEIKSAITEYLGKNPSSCTREIAQGTNLDRSVTYDALCVFENKHDVERRGGLDGTTITFIWKLLD